MFVDYHYTGFLNPVYFYFFPKLFALRAYGYSDLDIIFPIGKYLFISIGMTTHHGYNMLVYLD